MDAISKHPKENPRQVSFAEELDELYQPTAAQAARTINGLA